MILSLTSTFLVLSGWMEGIDSFVPILSIGTRPQQLQLKPQKLLQAKLSSEEIRDRLNVTMTRLREKDRKTTLIDPKDLKIVYEDTHLIVVNKPAGVLSVPSEPGVPSLVESVFQYLSQQQIPIANSTDYQPVTKMNQMAVHRLGMDTSGLIVFAKSIEALRGMNTLFRTRKITRQYEALVCGHLVAKNHGLINLPVMRDYEYPPFMRISSDEHQRNLLDLDEAIVGHHILQAPKASLTHFQVLEREYYKNNTDLPITRLTLTSISGRTHQLNVHCAAYGHPIVHDLVYGYKGEAAPYGGLAFENTISNDRAPLQLQAAIYEASKEDKMCVHCKVIRFKHPITKEPVEVTSPVPF